MQAGDTWKVELVYVHKETGQIPEIKKQGQRMGVGIARLSR